MGRSSSPSPRSTSSGSETRPEATEAERTRLQELKISLDQCWDLLRQLRALRGAGRDPDTASVRPAEAVERYEQ
jgi:Protein of unknown function (DUF2630)